MYESYAFLRPIVIFAGAIGIFQSLAWISLTITGLVAHYCNLDFAGFVASFGTITELTLFRLYFHGDCLQLDLPFVDFSPLDGLNLQTPGGVHAWMWVYLVVSIFWLISSITLIAFVTHRFIKIANIFLYIWIVITVALSLMDLSFGILFALDYNDTMFLAHHQGLGVPLQHVLIAAQTAIGAMMTIAFRGFVLWIINVALCIYLFAQTFNIFDYNKFQPVEPIGTTNRAFVNEEKNHPIDAFGNKNQPNLWLAPTVAVDQRHRPGSALYEERKRHYENQPLPHHRPNQPISTFYPPPRSRDDEIELRRDNNNARLVRELSHRNSRPVGRDEPNVPAPDYSPQMPHSNPYDASPLRPTQKQPSRY